jgi:Zn finger protein HypA/HybF involved in hydrogenase expression
MNKDSRKRTRCKQCKERVNLAYKSQTDRFYCLCPKCGSHGEVRFTTIK